MKGVRRAPNMASGHRYGEKSTMATIRAEGCRAVEEVFLYF